MIAKIEFLIALLVGFFIFSYQVADAAPLQSGDIVMAAQIGSATDNDFGLMVVDPTTGNRTILSDNTVGSGPTFASPEGIAVEPDGDLLVTDLAGGTNGTARVFRVDPTTGDRTLVTTYYDPKGVPLIHNPYGVLEVNGTILVAEPYESTLLQVDPTTGVRSYVNYSGQSMFSPIAMVNQGNNLFIADYDLGVVYRLDLSTGVNVPLSLTQPGPIPAAVVDIANFGNGDLILSSREPFGGSAIAGVFELDPVTLKWTLLSGGTVGTGPTMGQNGPAGIAEASNGQIILGEDSLNVLFSVDPLTGNRTILSDSSHGSGPSFLNPQGLLVIQSVPEPSSLALLCIGIALAGIARRARR